MVRWIYLVAYCPDPSLLEIWLNGKRSKFSKLKHNLNIDSSIPSAIWPSTDRSRFLQPGSYEARDAGAAAAARPCELGVGARSYGCLDVPFGPPGLRAAGRAHGGGHAGGGRLDVPDSPDVKHCAVCLESDRHLGPLFPLCCCSEKRRQPAAHHNAQLHHQRCVARRGGRRTCVQRRATSFCCALLCSLSCFLLVAGPCPVLVARGGSSGARASTTSEFTGPRLPRPMLP